mgnify:CR=1 FL=1
MLIVQGACQRFALPACGRAWTMLENAAESHTSGARFVGCVFNMDSAVQSILLEGFEHLTYERQYNLEPYFQKGY